MTQFFNIFILVLLANSALAKNIELSHLVEKKQSIISGSLNPAALSFNGQALYQSAESYAGLLVNNTEVAYTEVSGIKTFHLSLDVSAIELKWIASDGKTKTIAQFDYPALNNMYFNNNGLNFQFNEKVVEAKIDSQKIVANKFKIDNFNKWLGDIHTLELIGSDQSSQIYNLNFTQQKSELLRNRSWGLLLGDAPFYGSSRPHELQISMRVYEHNNWSKEFIVGISQTEYTTYYFVGSDNKITQETMSLKYRHGYNPFDTNPHDFNYKRLTLGVMSEFIVYERVSEQPTAIDGYFDTNVKHTNVGAGIFFRWEPYYYEDFGFVLSIDVKLFKTPTNLDVDKDNHAFGVTYNF